MRTRSLWILLGQCSPRRILALLSLAVTDILSSYLFPTSLLIHFKCVRLSGRDVRRHRVGGSVSFTRVLVQSVKD